MKKIRKQIGSLLLAVCMVFTMMPTVAFADSTSQIISFEALANDVDFQEVKSGTTVDGLNLPNTLTATVTTGSAYTATVSDWVSVPLYDGNTTGNYTFTPTLNLPSDVTLADGVTPPTITLYVLPFVPVKSIDGVINVIGVGNSYALGGRAYPANATNQDISWSISDAGTTGATITDGIISATTAGTVTVKAEIINGKANGTNYIENASIRVMALTVDLSTYTFDPLEEGYGKDEYFYLDDAQPKTFTITNTGDTVIKEINIRFLLDDGSWYSTSSIPTSLNSKASAEFTVEPISNLSAGNYTTIFYVFASNDVLALIPVSLTVTERLPRLRFGETDVHKVDTDFSGTGYSWNATTKTLTLTSDYVAGSIEFFDFDSETATLKLSGDVTIDETASWGSCLYNTGNLTIDLDGHTLTLITGGDNNEALSGRETTIQNGTLVARLLGSSTEESTPSIYASDLIVENATVIADADSLNYGGIHIQYNLTLKQGAKIYTYGLIGLKFSSSEFLNLESDDISLTAIGSMSAVDLQADLKYTAGSALNFWTNTDTTQPSPAGGGTLLSSKTRDECRMLWATSKYVYIGTKPQKNIVTVTNGTGSGEYTQNAFVNITADTPPSGKQFKEWTVISGGVTLANSKAANTTFTMPANAVEVTATYENIPDIGNDITANFSDANFLVVVRKALKKAADEPIYDNDDFASIKRLDAMSKNIESLEGIEYFTELAVLYCNNNNLTELDVSNNTKLTWLSCNNNQLSALDVSNNTVLTNLYCYNNKLKTLDVSRNTVLIKLHCNNNQLTELDVSKNASLTELFCEYNKLTELDVSKNKALAMLDCYYNYMSGEAAVKGLDKSLTTDFTFDPQNSSTSAYAVTVNSGTASSSTAVANATVTITAGSAPNGQQFKEWTVVSGGVTLANSQASSTTFTMPAKAVEVTANYEDISGGGSGGGSSSGGSSPANTATLKKNQPNQPITAVSSVTATVGTNGKASASIPDKAVTDAISKAQEEATKQKKTENGISIGLNVKMPKGATTLTATLSQNALNSLVSAGVTNLEINGSPVTISFDKKALKEIQKQTNGNVNITIAPKTNLTETAKKMIGSRPVYNITVGHGNNDTVSSFGSGVATIAIPYTPANGEAISGLYAVYVDENGNATRVEGSAYDIDSGSVLFTTPHFSMYGVGYTPPSEKLTDISNHWAKESIDYVVDKGMVDGATETTFAPDTFMTRGTLVTALGRLTGKDVSSYTISSFTDVEAGSTSQPYIEWAYKEGIIHGIGNNEFAPDRAITREEIAVIIANFTKATGYTLPVVGEVTIYADASSIGDYYKTAVTAMQQAGIMTGGTGNKFNPKSNATRAEVSSMLHRYIKLIVD